MAFWLSLLSIGMVDAAAPQGAAVQLIGRARLSDGVWQVTWPGVGWRTAFSGSQIGVTTQDTVSYSVSIDGARMKSIPPMATRQTTWYRGLAVGNHVVEVIRMQGTRRSAGMFFGFALEGDGQWLPLPSAPNRQIEFIGDSGLTGYGDLSTTTECSDEETTSRSDASQSYAILAAHQLHADWQLNAVDGIGLVRNYQGIWKGTNYGTYAALTLQSDTTSHYLDRSWHPQAVVVRIGQNDLGSPPGADEPWTPAQLETEFVNSYRSLLEELRERLGPRSLIIVLPPTFARTPANQKVAAIVSALRSAGDRRLYEFQVPKLELTGCNFHPNLSDDHRLAAALVRFINEQSRRGGLW